MKFPNHILLDFSDKKLNSSAEYWVFSFFSNVKNNSSHFYDYTFQKKFFLNKEQACLSQLLKYQKKYTLRYNLSNPSLFLSRENISLVQGLHLPRFKVKNRVHFSNYEEYLSWDHLNTRNNVFDDKTVSRLYKNFSFKNTIVAYKTNSLWNLFDINFLRKERIYTKLKYSRVPQYDIVSGGSAALFAGFLGFLICEKFGFELLDSGDFYILFMYVVFLCFFLRLFLRIASTEAFSWNIISWKWLVFFYKTIVVLIFRFLSFIFKC